MDAERRDGGRIGIPGERGGEDKGPRRRKIERKRKRENRWTDAAAPTEGGPRFKGDNESPELVYSRAPERAEARRCEARQNEGLNSSGC